jgi:superfamily II DNA or RNA helicase
MVRRTHIIGAPGVPAATVTAPVSVDTERLVERMARALRAFPEPSIEQGRSILGDIGEHTWDPRRHRFTLPVASRVHGLPESSIPVTVTCAVRFDRDFELAPTCTCGSSGVSTGCAHAWAALYHLWSLLAMRPDTIRLDVEPSSDDDPNVSRSGEPWTESLDALDRLLGRTPDAVPDARGRRPAPVQWLLRTQQGSGRLELELEPHEVRAVSRGTAAVPHPVSWTRFSREPRYWSRPSERVVAGLCRQTESVSRAAGTLRTGFVVDMFDLIEQLAGDVEIRALDAPGLGYRRIDARLGALLRRRDDGRLELVPALGREFPLDDPARFRIFERGVIAIDESRRELHIASANAARLALARHLITDGIAVPVDKVDELLSRLAAIESLLPVWVPPELDGEATRPDARIRLLLSPGVDWRLRLAIRVRPLEDGAEFAPAIGNESCYRFVDGRRISTLRDFDAESTAAHRVADELGLSEERVETRWTWELRGPEAVLEFLARVRGVLETDPGALVAEWPEGGEIEVVHVKEDSGALKVQIRERGEFFSLDGFLDVDESRVVLALVLDRIEQGSRFVPMPDGSWAELSRELVDRLSAIARISRKGEDTRSIDRTSLPVVEETLSKSSIDVERCGLWKELAKRFESSPSRIPEQPTGLHAELRDYQKDGFRWMTRLAHLRIGACLADDMGLGKTLQTLAVLVDRAGHGPSLVVAPTSVTDNWLAESKRFTPSLHTLLYRDTDRTGTTRSFQRGDLVIVSYGLLRRDLARLEKQRWSTVVLDEAQSIKNSRSLVAKAARALDARWRLALTGTPIENHLGELWSLFQFLSPEILGSWDSFKESFAAPIEKEDDADSAERLASITRPFILRRTKKEVLHELPSRTDVVLRAELSADERRLYENARLASLARLAKRGIQGVSEARFEVLAALTRLRQLACHPRLVFPESGVRSAKMELLLETLEALRAGGHHALVFSQFTSHLALVRAEVEARGFRVSSLDGQMPARQRAKEVEKFQSGASDVFLISLMAGGTGLNLTTADYVIHLDPWWNPAVEDQATDRAHRMGQKRPVTVYRLVARDTVEEDILALQSEKRALLARVLDGADRVAKVSTAELLELIRVGLSARASAAAE